ncbi:metallophosphoesterase [Paludisphaera rhizosphaerae]|uniref:metallophosphoesterase n=1 Tax=Paludisphaera rhizosphaerae TaxID=2711216 RepID=UPI0013EE2B22|nr:metallophosphoesterase [Paludisphaera rhizosphaerae]
MIDHEGWLLTPEGAAIRPEEATAVVADVHLGYEWARGAAGDCVPSHSLAETCEGLARVLSRANVRRLVVAGDLVESHRPCARTAADVGRLGAWLAAREVELVLAIGNHDRGLSSWEHAPRTVASFVVAGWTIQHGDRAVEGDLAVIGHFHPALRAGGLSTRCFVAGPRLLVLPAFSRDAAGLDVVSAARPKAWKGVDLRCLAAVDDSLLDFGPLDTLTERLTAAVRSH